MRLHRNSTGLLYKVNALFDDISTCSSRDWPWYIVREGVPTTPGDRTWLGRGPLSEIWQHFGFTTTKTSKPTREVTYSTLANRLWVMGTIGGTALIKQTVRYSPQSLR